MAYVQHSSVISAPRQEVFKVISNMENLPKLVPSDYHLTLTAPPIQMRKGAEYEFQFQRYGISHVWSVRVDDFIQDELLVERQVLGLFDTWILSTQLEDHGEGSTLVSNYLEYELPLGIAGKLFDDLWLRRDLKRLLEKSQAKLPALI